MLEILNDLLNEEELIYLKKLSDNFIVEDKRLYTQNEYDRMIIKNTNVLKSYQSKMNNYLKNLNNEYVQMGNIWMTKTDNSITTIDNFHIDISDLTFVSYFDINFTGGEFQYKDTNNNEHSIVPQKNMTLLMTNNVAHRITPVKSGNRHSLVTFFSLKEKTKKTLL